MRGWAWGLVLAAMLSGCFSEPPGAPTPASTLADDGGAPFAFDPPVPLPGAFFTGEPSLLVDGDTLYVAAPSILDKGPSTLSVSGHLWRSQDGGATYELLRPLPVGVRGAAIGGSDSSLALSSEGALYYADLWAGSTSLGVSRDAGATWTFTRPFTGGAAHDRPWIAAAEGALHLAWQTPGVGEFVATSRDGGLTWSPPQLVLAAPAGFASAGPLVADPDGRVLVAAKLAGYTGPATTSVALSRDGGASFTTLEAPPVDGEACGPLPVAAALLPDDRLAVAWCAREAVHVAVFEEGAGWSSPIAASPPGTKASMVALASRGNDLALAWYAFGEGAWRVEAARVDAATGTRVAFATAVDAIGDADALLGDFLSVAFAPDGGVLVAYTDANRNGKDGVVAVVRAGPRDL